MKATSTKTRKALLLNDTSKWYHFGCTATSTALKEQILSLGYELTSISITETYKIKDVPSSVREFSQPYKFIVFAKNNRDLLLQIQASDLLIINGEGTLHGVRPAPLALLYVAFMAKRFMNKHVEIINHSVYPQDDLSIDNKEIIELYKLVYRTVDFVAIREPESQMLMSRLGIKSAESFDCMPLYIKRHFKPTGIKSSNTLVIAGSAAWLNLNILSQEKGDIEKFQQDISQFIEYINKMHAEGFKVKFLVGAAAYPSKDDMELIACFKDRGVKGLEVIEARSLDEWLAIIESATLLVSGRFHHSIAAYCLGTPFIALNSNTPKVDGFLKSIGAASVLQYGDHHLGQRLAEITKVKLGEKIDSPKRSEAVEELCSKAMKNFLALIDLAKSKETDIIQSFKQEQAAIKIQHAWRKYITSHPQIEKQLG